MALLFTFFGEAKMAEETFESLEAGNDAYESIDIKLTNLRGGQTFTPQTAHRISQFDFHGFREAAATGTGTVEIYATDGTDPTGPVIASGTFDISTMVTGAGGGWITVAMTGLQGILHAGVKYAAVIKTDTDDYYIRMVGSTGSDYANGDAISSNNGGTSWTTYAANDAKFRDIGFEYTAGAKGGLTGEGWGW
jgi:hypothetical protein